MQIKDGIYGTLVRLEGKVVNGNCLDNFFQKCQR
jgi:hypothetical protein